MSEITEEIADTIKELRDSGLSVRVVAEQLQLSEHYVRRFQGLGSVLLRTPRKRPPPPTSEVGKSQLSSCCVAGGFGARTLIISTTDPELISYIECYLGPMEMKDGVYSVEDDPQFLLFTLPGLPLYFESFELPADLWLRHRMKVPG